MIDQHYNLDKAMTEHQITEASEKEAGAPEGGEIVAWGSRGVWVPDGMSADEIMRGATVLEELFDVPPYQSRSMVRAVLQALRS